VLVELIACEFIIKLIARLIKNKVVYIYLLQQGRKKKMKQKNKENIETMDMSSRNIV
jgi:hypothetical protein